MWEQKSIQRRQFALRQPDMASRVVLEHLAEVQNQTVNNALDLWWKQWTKTVADPASMTSTGLYRDRALTYWLLGNVINRDFDLARRRVSPSPDAGTWTLKVPLLMRKLTALMDTGHLDAMNQNSISLAKDHLEKYLPSLEAQLDGTANVEGMDTIVLNCMMQRDTHSAC
jgi:hypothetical protein